jgi:hypothetical protein
VLLLKLSQLLLVVPLNGSNQHLQLPGLLLRLLTLPLPGPVLKRANGANSDFLLNTSILLPKQPLLEVINKFVLELGRLIINYLLKVLMVLLPMLKLLELLLMRTISL